MVGPLERPSRVPGSLSILESAVASRRERTTDGATPHRFLAVQRASTPLLDGSARLTPLLIQLASAPPRRSVRPALSVPRSRFPATGRRFDPCSGTASSVRRDRATRRPASPSATDQPIGDGRGTDGPRTRAESNRIAARGVPRILESPLEAYGNPSIGASVKIDRVRRRRPRSPKIRDSVTPFGLRHRPPESALRMRYASSASSPASSVTVTQK